MRALLIGYGNPGRGDDGLGPALAEALAAEGIPGLQVEVDFQLNVENAFDLKGFDAVYFADAAVQGAEPFEFRQIQAADPTVFSSHSLSPEGLLALASQLFNIKILGYVLAIRGYEFDQFGAPLSPRAQENLAAALAHMRAHFKAPFPAAFYAPVP